MGLDNGISVRRNSPAFERNYKWFSNFEEEWSKTHEYDIDICYWRKCYNIRNAIFDKIESVSDNDISANLTVEDIDIIIEILAFYDEDSWENGGRGGSIWEWEVIQPILCKQCAALMELHDLMIADPEIEVYFYDSY